MGAIIGIIIFIVIMVYMNSEEKNPGPAWQETEEELIADGYTKKEARREVRRQRYDKRAQSRNTMQTMNTATRLGKAAKKLTDKL